MRILNVILIVLVPIFAKFTLYAATPFIPAVKYYSVKDFNAGHQNWSVGQSDDGIMYFGNNNGLLSFDGYRWELNSMPKQEIVRSVMCEGSRIYVGAFENFGYYEEDNNGKLHYHSITPLLKRGKMHNDEIWKIFRHGKYIYFQSFSSYYKYDGNTLTHHFNNDTLPLYLHPFGKKLYAQIINSGLCEVVNDKYVPFLDLKALGSAVISIQPGHNANEMMLITENNGIYYYNEEKGLTPFATQIDSNLKTYHVNRVTMSADSMLMIGTTMDGIYAINRKGEFLWHYNRDMRLNNNTVLGLYCDNERNIWASLDDGISYIRYNSPITLYSPASTEPKFGMVFDVQTDGSDFYLATNQGLYKYNADINKTNLIPNTEAQNWYVKKFDNQIFCGNNFHSMTVTHNIGIPIPGTTGSTSIKRCNIYGEDILLESSYTNFHIYRKDSRGEWKLTNHVSGLVTPIKDFEVDASGTIWASHMYSGMYQINLYSDFTKISKYRRIYNINKSAKRSTIAVIKINGRIVFVEDDKFFTYDDISQKIIPFNKLNQLLHNVFGVQSAVAVNDNTFWLIGENEYNLIKYENGNYQIIHKLPFSIFDNPCLGNEANAFISDKRFSYLNLNNSVARYDIHFNALPIKPTILKIKRIQALSNNEMITLPREEESRLSSDFREIIFDIQFPHFDNIPIKYVYTLNGGGDHLKSENNKASIRYSSLNYGDYEFNVIAYNAANIEIGSASYKFTISPPFLLSMPILILYFILFIAIIYFFSKWKTRRVVMEKQKEYEQAQMQQRMKLNEQERLISEQNKQILETELTLKSKELASLTMGAIAKNSALEEIKVSIQEQLQKDSGTKKFLNSLLNQINENIENKEFWILFQQNFDLIHANFFRNLRSRYPELTPNDLKFCALIRLNMSTKEIAHMTNLTIRGVEAARYRIRKKLELPESGSMVNFLIEIK